MCRFLTASTRIRIFISRISCAKSRIVLTASAAGVPLPGDVLYAMLWLACHLSTLAPLMPWRLDYSRLASHHCRA